MNQLPKYLLLAALFFSCAAKSQNISLAGKWKFEIDRADKGIGEKWFLRNLTDEISLPGSMNSNSKGDDITLATKWTGSIYDSSFYFNPRLAKYRQPGNIHIPFWLTPNKHYVGVAWYQKNITVPSGWKSKCVVLYLERAHIETSVWIDHKEAGIENSLVSPHEHYLGILSPGPHRITIRIDNRIKAINPGPDSHSITDHTQGNWNGIIGKIFLSASSPVYFSDIQIFPDPSNHKAVVKMTLVNRDPQPRIGKVSLHAERQTDSDELPDDRMEPVVTDFKVTGQTNIEAVLSFGPKMQTWDEFSQVIYQLSASLQTTKGDADKKNVEFGMREFKIEGNKFMINGRPVFLRGTVNNCEFPLTGFPAMDVAAWQRIFQVAKNNGLNHMRFHSWCPPEAAFVAADRIGFYLQPEGPSWPNHGPKIGLGQPIDKFLYDETERMVKAYGNHPSFTMLSAGNEPAGNQVKYLSEFVDYWKKKDNRRVYTGMSVGGSWPVIPNAEYQVRGGVRGLAWDKQPETISDFSSGVAKFAVPFVAHEMGQWCAFPDFDEIDEYKGAYHAKNFELFKQDLKDHGMEDQAHDFLSASSQLQTLCYKHEIEKTLRTPDYAGFQLLGLQDFPGQGTALVGTLNAFWETKHYVQLYDFSKFCNVAVPLARIAKFVFHNDEVFEAGIELFNSGSAGMLKNAVVQWAIINAGHKRIAQGSFDPRTFENGNGIPVGKIQFDLKDIQTASKLKLEVSVLNTVFRNDWNFWVYPTQQTPVNADIYYTDTLDEKATAILDKGGKVFLEAAGKVIKGKEVAMHFLPVFWNTSWFKMRPPHVTGILVKDKSAAFKDFPTDYFSDLQWWDIVNRSQVMILEDFPPGLKPLVQPIDTWFLNRRLALVFEVAVGKGKLLVSSAGLLNAAEKRPAAKQLFYSLQRYMASADFDPAMSVSIDVVKDIFIHPSKETFNTYTKDSPDELKPKAQ